MLSWFGLRLFIQKRSKEVAEESGHGCCSSMKATRRTSVTFVGRKREEFLACLTNELVDKVEIAELFEMQSLEEAKWPI